MNRFLVDALFAGIKNGLVSSFSLFLALSFFRRHRAILRIPVLSGLLIALLASMVLLAIPLTPDLKDIIVKLTGYAFGFFYLLSLLALYHRAGTDLLGPFRSIFFSTLFLSALVLLLSVLYFVPDMAGCVLFVSDLYSMAGQKSLIFASAGAAFVLSFAAATYLGNKNGAAVHKLVDLPQLLLFLALIKLVSGTAGGGVEFSLVPSVQSGLMKLVHDVLHQLMVMLMVPDHPILTVTAWNFIAVLFGRNAGLWLSLLILFVPLALFLTKHFTSAIETPSGLEAGPVRRTAVKAEKNDRVLKAVPVFLFMAVIAILWFSERGESAAQLYNPEPRPVVATNDQVIIELESIGGNLRDGSLHKYVVHANGEEIRFLVIKKPDGTLSACLDACDICPPDGYAQGQEHVVCLYCRTPIPFTAIGTAGGCNPVPLAALVTDKDIRIDVMELFSKWKLLKTGAGREGLRK